MLNRIIYTDDDCSISIHRLGERDLMVHIEGAEDFDLICCTIDQALYAFKSFDTFEDRRKVDEKSG